LKTGDRTRKKFSFERKKTNEQSNGDRKIKEKKCRRSKKKTQ